MTHISQLLNWGIGQAIWPSQDTFHSGRAVAGHLRESVFLTAVNVTHLSSLDFAFSRFLGKMRNYAESS